MATGTVSTLDSIDFLKHLREHLWCYLTSLPLHVGFHAESNFAFGCMQVPITPVTRMAIRMAGTTCESLLPASLLPRASFPSPTYLCWPKIVGLPASVHLCGL